MFNSSNTRKLSLLIATIICFISIAINLLFSYFFYAKINWEPSIVISISIFIFAFLFTKLIMERFIYDRIKVIYKTINRTHNFELLKENGDVDIIGRVNKDVEKWAAERNSEIENLKKMENYRREYIGDVSHELKTPITTIQGYVLTLLDGGLEDKSINHKYLRRTAKNIDRLIAIINDLEEISRIETGMMKMNILRTDFSFLVKDVFDFMEIKAQKNNVKFVYTNGFDKPVWINADQSRIRQVMINLIDNAIKYGKSGETVTVSVFNIDSKVLIEVSDEGHGISKDDLPRIFERFFRTDKSRSRDMGGTGLGLSIVKHIIEAHEQTITVRSTIDMGTTFSFTMQKAKK